VSLYFPERSHQAFGVIRAVLRDSTDMDIGDVSQVSTIKCRFCCYAGKYLAMNCIPNFIERLRASESADP